MIRVKKRKGFTLIELVVAIIIIGILATIGIAQYTRMVEKGRGAEARTILGSIRTAEEIWRTEYGTTTAPYTSTWANLGMDAPTACQPSHYFSYGVGLGTNSFIATATRCTGGGKSPDYATANTTIVLTGYAGNSLAVWSGTGYGSIW